MIRWITAFLWVSITVSSSLAWGQSASIQSGASPKREFRGAWIATVSNIDWPATGAQTAVLATLDSLKGVGVNAILFQVRPMCDAFYSSSIEPWSQWVAGTQGVAPNPYYDPLQFMIDACHARGMELHAWFNPYRAAMDSTKIPNFAPNHVARVHPEWLLSETGTKLKILNPGIADVRLYVVGVIMDVLRRYDVDGIHFDDYFYPYGGIGLQDYDLWVASGTTLALYDWRRENVNTLIQTLHDSIGVAKPKVKFGIGPFGIWRNQSSDPNGSATNGNQSYDTQYADTRRWLQEGWIDYLAPQLYWMFTTTAAPYGVLADWWNVNAASRQIYIGEAVYRAVDRVTYPTWSVKELQDHIVYSRTKQNIYGNVLYSGKYFKNNNLLLNDSLRMSVYPRVTGESIPKSLALLPIMSWRDAIPPLPPDSFRIQIAPTNSYAFVRWAAPPPAADSDRAEQYLLYRSTTLPIDFSNLSNVVSSGTSTAYATFNAPYGNQIFYFAATSLDRRQNESVPTRIVGWSATGEVIVGVEPSQARPAEFRLSQNFPNPFNPATLIEFTLAADQNVSLRVYDMLGREVATLFDGRAKAGLTQVTFDGQGFPSGVYFYRLTGGGQTLTRKMQLMK